MPVLIDQEQLETCKKILLGANVNPVSTIEYNINAKSYTVTLEWIIESYLLGSKETRELFTSSLKKMVAANPAALKEYFENMGKLILMASLSQKDLPSS